MQATSTNKRTSIWTYSTMIGMIAGLFTWMATLSFYYLNFSQVKPEYLAEPFFLHHFLQSRMGWLIGLLGMVGFSIGCAYLYSWLFRKMIGPWAGIIYGLCWWFILFVSVGPAFHLIRPMSDWKSDTIIVEACLFLLWGVFIGYSISYEFTDVQQRNA